MSYIEIEIGGKIRGIRFNQIALEIFDKHLNLQAPVSSAIYATFYAGLYGQSVLKREDIDYTFEQVSIWVDEFYEKDKKEEIEKICEMWQATTYYRNWLKEFNDNLNIILGSTEAKPKKKMKKNLNGLKSTSSPLVG